MKKTRMFFTLLLLTHTFYCTAQKYAVNDIVPDVKPDTFLYTQPITGPKVVFLEKKFSLKLSKTDLINALKASALQWNKEDEAMFRVAIDYLSTTNDPVFKYTWAKGKKRDDLTWKEAERAGGKLLTQKLLKEVICDLLERGNFELFLAGRQEKEYFTGLVDTEFGKHAKGIFTATKRLIWICPPWVVCELPPF